MVRKYKKKTEMKTGETKNKLTGIGMEEGDKVKAKRGKRRKKTRMH